MIIPVRCFTCNRVLASKYKTYKDIIASETNTENIISGDPNIDLSQERDELVRAQVVSEVSSDLTSSEVEKLTKLIEDLDQDEDFAQNVQTIKESYFSDSKEKLQLDEEVVSDSDENTSTEDKILDPSMAAYSAALGKIDPNKYR